MPYFSATPIFSFVAAAAAETGSSVVEVAVDVPLRAVLLVDEAAASAAATAADNAPIRTPPLADEAATVPIPAPPPLAAAAAAAAIPI